jgi:hypothetical protein
MNFSEVTSTETTAKGVLPTEYTYYPNEFSCHSAHLILFIYNIYKSKM